MNILSRLLSMYAYVTLVLFIVVYLVGSIKVSGNFSDLLVQQHTAYSIRFRVRCINVESV